LKGFNPPVPEESAGGRDTSKLEYPYETMDYETPELLTRHECGLQLSLVA